MVQNKYLVMGGSALVIVVLAVGGGVAAMHGHHGQADMEAGLGSAGTAQATTDESGTTSDGGLGVGSSANDLGQISPTQKNSSGSANASLAQGGTTGSSGSGSSSSGLPDPSTFAAYDKYKTNTQALFGDIQPGTGATLGAGQTASVYYRGYLTNGTLFDATRNGSDGKPQAFSFKMGAGQVIPGWEEGLAGMKVGGVRLVIVPPSVGYGAAGQPPSIPGNSVLVFEVQLLGVQ